MQCVCVRIRTCACAGVWICVCVLLACARGWDCWKLHPKSAVVAMIVRSEQPRRAAEKAYTRATPRLLAIHRYEDHIPQGWQWLCAKPHRLHEERNVLLHETSSEGGKLSGLWVKVSIQEASTGTFRLLVYKVEWGVAGHQAVHLGKERTRRTEKGGEVS